LTKQPDMKSSDPAFQSFSLPFTTAASAERSPVRRTAIAIGTNVYDGVSFVAARTGAK
jgi:hypothetical protein